MTDINSRVHFSLTELKLPDHITPLMAAMCFSEFEVVQRMISEGANPYAVTGEPILGGDAVMMACLCGRAENVRAFLHAVPSWPVNRRRTITGVSALRIAVLAGSNGCVQALLEAKADPHEVSSSGLTLLHELFQGRCYSDDTMELLVEAGVDLDAQILPSMVQMPWDAAT